MSLGEDHIQVRPLRGPLSHAIKSGRAGGLIAVVLLLYVSGNQHGVFLCRAGPLTVMD